MAVRAKQFEIVKGIVFKIAVDMINLQWNPSGDAVPLVPAALLTTLAANTDQEVPNQLRTMLAALIRQKNLNCFFGAVSTSAFFAAIQNSRSNDRLLAFQAVRSPVRALPISDHALIVYLRRAGMIAELVLALFKWNRFAAAGTFWRSRFVFFAGSLFLRRDMQYQLMTGFLPA